MFDLYSPSRETETLYQRSPLLFSKVGLSQYKVVESVTVAFDSKVPLKIHLAFPKPNSTKFLPLTRI